jgi:hypothetical protein
MRLQKKLWAFLPLLLASTSLVRSEFPMATNNDPYPIYSSIYPYSYLATRQKAHLMQFEYAYPVDKFRISVSAFGQFARRARDPNRNVINIGDINGRWNMLGLFYDPPLRNQLFKVLGLQNLETTNPECFLNVTDPTRVDPNQEFGFFTIPIWYRKYGARFEGEMLIVDKCFYAIGVRVQWGISEVRQTVMRFDDLTCQALGIACPSKSAPREPTAMCAVPAPVPPSAITPPFLDPNSQAPCPQNSECLSPCFPAQPKECVTLPQAFEPCCDQTTCLSFDSTCKQIVIEKIMKEKDRIAEFLGLEFGSYQKVGVEDLRIDLFWREIFVINEESDVYPRLLFMPFAEVGVSLPMARPKPTNKPLAVPISNNGHISVAGKIGGTLDFLDTIDLSFAAGFSYFFERDFCKFRLPTNAAESGIFPYTADVTIRPGPSWFLAIGMHAYRFLDNLSVWAEYMYITHDPDHFKICRSFIPSQSNYFRTGFDLERAERLSSWDFHIFNIGFNYELSDHLVAGVFVQIPLRERNAYRSAMVLGTLSFIY